MPNIVRRPRSRRPEPRVKRPCDSGTHLTDEQRRRIHFLSQHLGCSQRAIASTLRLPRTTVQSAIYDMTGRSKKQQHRRQTSTSTPNSTSAIEASNKIIYITSAPCMRATARPDVRQAFSPYSTCATPIVPSNVPSIPGCYHRLPSRCGTVSCSGDNAYSSAEAGVPANNSHCCLANLMTEHIDFEQFDAYGSTRSRTSLQQIPPRLMPMEPRIVYKSTPNHA
ncbi:hypothetical protein K469DRAFT_711284 [Zopfia rhizophila CBS 207.26]|uniref:Transposase IS30-like HTH domain-containing protein n=1 Tax=Zopfia rhizophila CBS 207.26 TaxID=1314779 RepID=A0A6A6DTC8_9PEZI|nr:hypothetical protein K469DRAFT_711284 [Zopfia rhizophila CBS 207.26]